MTLGMPWLCVGTMQGDNNDGDISNAVIDDDDRDDDDDDDRDGDEYFVSAGCRSSTPYLVG